MFRQQRVSGRRCQHHRWWDAGWLACWFSLCPLEEDIGYSRRRQQHQLPQNSCQGLLLPLWALAQTGQGIFIQSKRRLQPPSRDNNGFTKPVNWHWSYWLFPDPGQPWYKSGQSVFSPAACLHPTAPHVGVLALSGTLTYLFVIKTQPAASPSLLSRGWNKQTQFEYFVS